MANKNRFFNKRNLFLIFIFFSFSLFLLVNVKADDNTYIENTIPIEINSVDSSLELNKNGNIRSTDVSIDSLDYEIVGKSTLLTKTSLSNNGKITVNVRLKYYFDNVLIGLERFSLAPQSKPQINKNFKIKQGTAYYLRVVVDIDAYDTKPYNNDASRYVSNCNKENILIVSDNDAEEIAHKFNQEHSYQLFSHILTTNGYCVKEWTENEQGVPGLDYLKKFALVIWSTSNYKNPLSEQDLSVLESYNGPIIFEGSNILFEDGTDNSKISNLIHADFNKKITLNDNTLLILRDHNILRNVDKIEINKEPSPYPQTLISLGQAVAEWPNDDGDAIVVYNLYPRRRSLYFAITANSFLLDSNPKYEEQAFVNTQRFILNSVKWLLMQNIEYTSKSELSDLSIEKITPVSCKIGSYRNSQKGTYYNVKISNIGKIKSQFTKLYVQYNTKVPYYLSYEYFYQVPQLKPDKSIIIRTSCISKKPQVGDYLLFLVDPLNDIPEIYEYNNKDSIDEF